ncbi:hypothetical protein KI387_037572, partial [Taxus chinensis]
DLSKKTIELKNECEFPVWPAIASWNTHENDTPAGFRPLLKPGESYSIGFHMSWQGSIWGRLGCTFDASERGHCYSGDCGGKLRCEQAPSEEQIATPITQAVFMNGFSAVDVEAGYNLPMSVVPSASDNNAGYQGCSAKVGAVCPKNLQVKHEDEVIGCKGGCDTYLGTCSPPEFSSAFREACPRVVPFQER